MVGGATSFVFVSPSQVTLCLSSPSLYHSLCAQVKSQITTVRRPRADSLSVSTSLSAMRRGWSLMTPSLSFFSRSVISVSDSGAGSLDERSIPESSWEGVELSRSSLDFDLFFFLYKVSSKNSHAAEMIIIAIMVISFYVVHNKSVGGRGEDGYFHEYTDFSECICYPIMFLAPYLSTRNKWPSTNLCHKST